MNKRKRMQGRIMLFVAASSLAIILVLVVFVMTLSTSANVAYDATAFGQPVPTLAVPPTLPTATP
jgi:hypothetical protein